MIRNIIFDWSGTLVDDLPAVLKASNFVLTQAGKAEMSLEKFRAVLLGAKAFSRGDPTGGGSTRQPIMTAYRQQALDCAALLREGPKRPRDLRPVAPDAAAILLRNVYGWFERVDRGLYQLAEPGHAALQRWGENQQ